MTTATRVALLELRKLVREAEETGALARSSGLDFLLDLFVLVEALPDLLEAQRAQAERDAAASEIDCAIELYALKGVLSGTTARALLERLAARLTKDDAETIALRWTPRIVTVDRVAQAARIAESVAVLRAAVPLH